MKRLALALLLMLPAMGADKVTDSGTVSVFVQKLNPMAVVPQYVAVPSKAQGVMVFVKTTALSTSAFNVTVNLSVNGVSLSRSQVVSRTANYSGAFFPLDLPTFRSVTIEELKAHSAVEFSADEISQSDPQ